MLRALIIQTKNIVYIKKNIFNGKKEELHCIKKAPRMSSRMKDLQKGITQNIWKTPLDLLHQGDDDLLKKHKNWADHRNNS